MARPLRILVEGGWYHVTARGNRRQTLFFDDTDRRRFLGMVEELPERFGLEVHAFVLMGNHYHLVVRTPEANLSHAIRWLNISYSMRLNWAHQLCGHVFQGRFKALLIEEVRGVVEVARYVHLNPVRIAGLGLGKAEQRRAKVLGCPDPGAELVRQRLATLRSYPWSSWRVYSGAEPKPSWLETGTIAAGCGGRNREEQRKALREYTESPVRQGRLEVPWEGLIGGLVLGTKEFARRLLKAPPKAKREIHRQITRVHRVTWPDIVHAAERVLKRPWAEMLRVRGDWGRDGTLYVAVRHGGHRLAEVVPQIEGLEYAAGAQAVRRFNGLLKQDRKRQRFVEKMKEFLANPRRDDPNE
jgi:putative transposase